MTHSYVTWWTWLIHVCDMTHTWDWHDLLRCDMTHSYVTWWTWLIRRCYVTRSHVGHMWCDGLCRSVTWLILGHMSRVNEWVTNEWVMNEWVMSQMNDTYRWVKSHICINLATRWYVWHVNENGLYRSVTDSFASVTWLIHPRDVTHSCVWHDTVISMMWLVHMCDMTHSYVWHDSFICVTWLIRMCAMPHSYVWHDSFMCVAWLIHMCDMTGWFLYVTTLMHMCAMTRSYVCRELRVTWLIHICDMNYSWV